MKRIGTIFLFLISIFTFAQGIKFETNSDWNQILEKAKAENKYIFVDCYATWCAPCKMMDETIYPLKEVGEYYNAHFISVKVQMDKTDKDDQSVIKWYKYAANIQNSYAVTSLPTYLFFTSDGTPIHKQAGALTADDFIELAKDAQDSNKQYFSVLRNFRPGKLDTAELKGLAKSFRFTNTELAGKMVEDYFSRIPSVNWNDESNLKFLEELSNTNEAKQLASKVLKELPLDSIASKRYFELLFSLHQDSSVTQLVYQYVSKLDKPQLQNSSNLDLICIFKSDSRFRGIADSYINRLSVNEMFMKDNISFINRFVNKSSDKAFQIFLENSKEIDNVMDQADYAESTIDKIISKEIVTPFVNLAKENQKEPDWNKLYVAIKNKYGNSYAKRNVSSAKPGCYHDMKRWKECAKYLVQYVNHYASLKPAYAYYLNNMAWSVFENTNDQWDLREAYKWICIALKSDTASQFYGGYMDTKANIMYRLGQKKKAVDLEEKAIALETRRDPTTKSYTDTLEKMKRGDKTWPEKIEGR